MKIQLLFALALIIASCSSEKKEVDEIKKEPVEQTDKSKYSYRVYNQPDVGWCYQIFRGSKMIINQKHIPAVPGILGFETQEKAILAVEFIMVQIEAGNEQPTVSPEELDSIGAITLDLPSAQDTTWLPLDIEEQRRLQGTEEW